MLAHIKDLVKDAEKNGYAIGAFNIHNLESVLAVAQTAVAVNSPAIIQVSEGAIEYMGLKPLTHIVSTVAKNIAASVPIALHLDHGKSLDSVFGCIDAGFTSVHIDASHLPLDENIRLTKQVTEFAHQKGVWVQGEVGAIIGGHGAVGGKIENVPIANVDDVVRFCKETKVDTIAAAIGTAHGAFTNETILIDLLKEIKEKTNNKPFVLHGGSGVDEDKIRAAIKAGVNIINIGTDIKVAFSTTLIKNCIEHQDETDPRNLLRPTIAAVAKVVDEKMKLFGSAKHVSDEVIET